jgi:purine catabolism regulator
VIRARGSNTALESALGQLERDSAELGHPLAARTAPGTDSDQLVAIIQAGDEQLDGTLTVLAGLEIGVGPGRPLAALGQSDDGARNALAAASALRPVVVWSELARAGVDSLLDMGTLSAFAEGLLEAVLARPDAPELLDGLRAFLSHNGHIGPAAESLGIHRNTLRNRLATAESQLDRSLHDPQFRSDLWVALKQVGGPSAGSWSLNRSTS